MKLLLLLLITATLCICSIQAVLTNYEIEGHMDVISPSDIQSKLTNRLLFQPEEDIISNRLSLLLSNQVSNFYIDYFEIHGIEVDLPTSIYHGYMTVSDMTRDQVLALCQNGTNSKVYYLNQIDSIPSPSIPSFTASNVTSCLNGGILLPNNTCYCPGFTSGDMCEQMNCLHSGISDGSRCSCPPGAYALNCEPRGCMPQIQGNVNFDTQTFINVLSLKSTMGLDINFWVFEAGDLIDSLNKQGILENYILVTFLQYKNTYYMQRQFFYTRDDFLTALRGVAVSDGSIDQPTIRAINDAQTFAPLMRPHSNILVMADSADTVGEPADYHLSSNSSESSVIQNTLAWRNKIVLIISETVQNPIDTYGDYFDIYRRIAKATHGDFIMIDKMEWTTVVWNFLPYYVQMENLFVRYQFDCSATVPLPFTPDSSTQKVNVIITVEYGQTLPSLQGTTTITPSSNGKYFAMYQLPSSVSSVSIVGTVPNTTCNARIFVSSPITALIAYSNDPLVDVGSGSSYAELNMFSSAYVAGTTSQSVSYQALDSSTGSVIMATPIVSTLRNTATYECTFPLAFPAWTCTPGPYTQQFQISIAPTSTVITRLIPGFCNQLDHHTAVPWNCLNGGTRSGVKKCSCTSNYNGLNCEKPICQNGGSIEQFPGNGRGFCTCQRGYSGQFCELLACSSSSNDTFNSYDRTLAVVIQNTNSQAQINSKIVNGMTALLNIMKGADAFSQYVVTTFATLQPINGSNIPTWATTVYTDSTSFLNAIQSMQIKYQVSRSITQPAYDALNSTLNAISNLKSAIFLFTDSPPDTTNIDALSIYMPAIQQQIEVNVVITAPYLMQDMCMSPNNPYFLLTKTTGGSILNLCQTYGTYNQDPIVNFLSSYGSTHHHTEKLQERYQQSCNLASNTTFLVDDPTAEVYVFVNSASAESFTVSFINLDFDSIAYQVPVWSSIPFLGIYKITPAQTNIKGYVITVASTATSRIAACTIRVVEKSLLTAYIGFSPDPSLDKLVGIPVYASGVNPVVHISSVFQSAATVTLNIYDETESSIYSSTGIIRDPSCHYENYFKDPFICGNQNSDFMITVTITTPEAVVQRTVRSLCYLKTNTCLNGGLYLGGKCNCIGAYKGPACEMPSMCANGGMVNPLKFGCDCPLYFSGPQCQIAECINWNFLETQDASSHKFRQITFVVEMNKGMILPHIILSTNIAQIISQTDNDPIPKQYTLITFDENVVTNVVSTSHSARFISKFQTALSSYTNTTPSETLATRAIAEALKITIQPPSIVFVFTSSLSVRVDSAQLAAQRQRNGIQVNIFYLPNVAYPAVLGGADYMFPLIARQSNGRQLSLSPMSLQAFSPALVSMVNENALILDAGYQDCTTGITANFMIESRASNIVITISGQAVNVPANVIIKDGGGNIVQRTTQQTTFTDSATVVLSIAPTGLQTSGNWTVVVTAPLACYVRVHAVTPVHVIPGFTSDINSDYVKHLPFSGLAQQMSNYVTFRVTNTGGINSSIRINSLQIWTADYSTPWNEKYLSTQFVSQRDVTNTDTSCANQFITNIFQFDPSNYQKFIVYGTDEMNQQFQRVFFFNKATTRNAATYCINGTPNPEGECICNAGYSGETCAQQQCLNGGTESLGICVCTNGYYGPNCANYLQDTTVTTMSTVTAA